MRSGHALSPGTSPLLPSGREHPHPPAPLPRRQEEREWGDAARMRSGTTSDRFCVVTIFREHDGF